MSLLFGFLSMVRLLPRKSPPGQYKRLRGTHRAPQTIEAKAAGRYEVIWNGADNTGRTAASGVYFVRMQAGDYVKTTKAVMLK